MSRFLALAVQLPDTRLVTLPAAGHLRNVERPDAYNDALRSFAAGYGSGTG